MFNLEKWALILDICIKLISLLEKFYELIKEFIKKIVWGFFPKLIIINNLINVQTVYLTT